MDEQVLNSLSKWYIDMARFLGQIVNENRWLPGEPQSDKDRQTPPPINLGGVSEQYTILRYEVEALIRTQLDSDFEKFLVILENPKEKSLQAKHLREHAQERGIEYAELALRVQRL